MKKIISTLLLSSLSISAFATQYDWKPIPIPQPYSNSYQNGNQQMQDGLNQMADALSSLSKKKEQTTYTTNGSFTHGSDGSSYYNSGDRSYGNDGNTYYQMNENSGYDSNGATYQRIGNSIYMNKPDGTRAFCVVSGNMAQCR